MAAVSTAERVAYEMTGQPISAGKSAGVTQPQDPMQQQQSKQSKQSKQQRRIHKPGTHVPYMCTRLGSYIRVCVQVIVGFVFDVLT